MANLYTLEALQAQRLPRVFYDNNTEHVAQALLGKCLVNTRSGQLQIGRIVEVEAYLGEHDKAAHSCKGLTPRTQVMFGPPGFAYVYLIYGMYHCMNVVTEPEGHASAVLIRALEPLQHIHQKTQGPGLLCRAMNIDKSFNAHDLISDDFFISYAQDSSNHAIVSKPRIGVDYAGEWAKKPLRFYIKDNPFISKK